jgi:hypothetical protein
MLAPYPTHLSLVNTVGLGLLPQLFLFIAVS